MADESVAKNCNQTAAWSSVAAIVAVIAWQALSYWPGPQCRCFPGDECWPSSADWEALNHLGSDQVLEEVITAEGKHLIVTPTRNQDLYWALSGGGGTYGVALSMNVKLHKDMPIAVVILSFTEATGTFWDIVRIFVMNLPPASTPVLHCTGYFGQRRQWGVKLWKLCQMADFVKRNAVLK
ncbi:hypothetical protein F4802DRAFT_603490 [Xylaria palmicola]|nr:hypothetical protein F4802DRAFT_603490 [Xylaria palmicola]